MRRLLTILILLSQCAVPNLGTEGPISESLASMVETERRFARTSVEKGMREAFLTYFADDGINFNPQLVNTKETMRKRPATPSAFTLNWSPVYGGVAIAGDLGYLTGPYELTVHSPQPRPPQYGCYFSIWKKQPDGKWRVAVDVGIKTPLLVAPLDSSFEAAPQTPPPARNELKAADHRSILIQRDREFERAATARGFMRAFQDYASVEARLYRDELVPLVGNKAIDEYLAQQNREVKWQPMRVDVSRSGDLGYTVGSYDSKSIDRSTTEKGYYVRVWKQGAKEGWKVIFDITSPLPAETK